MGRDLACPYHHPGGGDRPVLVIRPRDRTIARRLGGHELKPQVARGADVHCLSCHYESWIPVKEDWRPGDLSKSRVCTCGETYL